MSDDDLPEAPFIAGRVGDVACYHTHGCPSVKRSTRVPRHVTDEEVEFHGLSHCQYCSGAFEPGERRTQQDVLADIRGGDR